jgi:hypothetical protein
MMRSRIAVSQYVDDEPGRVWQLLTEPELMNTWSSARIRLVDPGAGGGPDGVGALRSVRLPGRGGTLLEVVRESVPPQRLVYVVVGGAAALRRHQGEISLSARGNGTEVGWQVDMAFVVPGLAPVAGRLIGRELGRSLARLAAAPVPAGVAAREPVARGSVARGSSGQPELAALRAEADRVLGLQREIADRLTAAEDPKRWFARVYQYVTEEQLAFVDEGEVDNPDWVLRLIPAFHHYYADNLAAFERGHGVEAPWEKAWALAEKGGATGSSTRTMKALLLGVAAHIEADLPRALATTYTDHFAGDREYVEFRADYLRMARIFGLATDRLVADMPRGYLPTWLGVARRVLPLELRDQLMRRYYDVPTRRLEAFAQGRRLATR